MSLHLNPQACLEALRVTRSVRSDESIESWDHSVACRCGAETGRVLGHWLTHPDRPPEQVFVGPLSFECQACGAIAPFLDTSLHGYDAALGADYNMKGDGNPAPFDQHFGRVIASFSYQIEDLEQVSTETGMAPADLFDSCCVWLVPSGGNERVPVAEFECA